MLPDDFKIVRADQASNKLLENLLQHYYYDMSEWFGIDTQEDGSFASDMEAYWNNNLATFIAYSGKLPVGFAMVQSAEKVTGDKGGFDVKDFFVLRKYRRTGAGRALAEHIWNAFRGDWVVRVYAKNRPAVPFWRKAVAAYCSDEYRQEERSLNGEDWVYFFFQNKPR